MILTRRVAVIVLLTSLSVIPRLKAQVTASFNFTAAAVSVSGWTNVSGDPSVAIRTATDASTGITISSVAGGNWAPISGVGSAINGAGAAGGTFFPATVMINQWFQYSSLAGYNAAMPQLLISGLNKDSTYTIKMTGSSNSANNSNPTQYSVTGNIIYGYIDVNCHGNTSAGATFNNITPDGSGVIKIYVNTVPTSTIACISGLQITRVHTNVPTPTVALTSPSNNITLPEDANITISATASETGGSITHVEFYRDTVKIGDDSTAPYSILWVASDPGSYSLKARAIDASGNASTATVNIQVESLNYFWSTTGNIATHADTFFVGTVDTNRLAFRTNNVERVSILSDGTVGIGTKATQGYKLAVNGSAIFTRVRIKNYAAWPDYVFKKDYRLTGLDSLEKYIRVNQHLPGMISAANAGKDGIDLADGQALLLKKIEELTLYLIREHKQVEKLTREVQLLKAQNKKKPGN